MKAPSGVERGASSRGQLAVVEAFGELPALPVPWGPFGAYLVSMDVEFARKALVLVGDSGEPTAPIRHCLRAGWERQLSEVDNSIAADAACPVPLVLSCGRTWHYSNGRLHVYGSARVVDGARRLLTLLSERHSTASIAAIVFCGLSDLEECGLRQACLARHAAIASPPGVLPPDDAIYLRARELPRCLIEDTNWRSLRIDSEPFLVATKRGYAPAVVVADTQTLCRQLLYISAQTLSLPFEEFRVRKKRLRDAHCRIRRVGITKTAAYQVEFELEAGS